MKPRRTSVHKVVEEIEQQVVEVISDSGEGAQRCGQSLGAIAARMGNGVWTVEIIPPSTSRCCWDASVPVS
jgi:2-oxoglutarate ferredoxin oxidoreductase subunit alpha